MIEALLTSPTTRMLEQTVNFTEQRHNVILTNIANSSVPGYVQQDVSAAGFQKALQDAIDRSRQTFNGTFEPESNDTVDFASGGSSVQVKPKGTTTAAPFHDRGVRNMESQMGDLADNAMAHNVATQLLKNRYDMVSKAISMRV